MTEKQSLNQVQRLEDFVKNFTQRRILVIGDVMLDRFVYGDVNRISPESPVPVLAIKREDKMLGGSGNAVSNLKGLGAKADLIACVGEDESAAQVKELIEELGYESVGILSFDDRPTTEKTRYLAGHQQLLRADYEQVKPLDATQNEKLLQKLDDALPGCDAVLMSDYGKGLLDEATVQAIIQRARSAQKPVIIDPKGTDYSRYKGASAITPNKKELSEATGGMAVNSDEEVIKAAQILIAECGIEAVIATRSKDGISVITGSDAPVHIKSASDVEVYDVSGAGDTVISVVAAAIGSGASLEDAARLANIAGSIVVAKVGTAAIRADELLERIDHSAGSSSQSNDNRVLSRARMAQTLSWDEAREEVQRWRARGLKVGFTNGCFDIVHYGHVSYLNEARSHCDRLIVGLNKDSSVRILKGPERPVHDEGSRAAVLGALGSTDLIVLFGAEDEGGDNTAIALLEHLQPDVYFKGGDYKVDDIPEAPTVQAYGGEVHVMSGFDGHSTTSSIAKMRA